VGAVKYELLLQPREVGAPYDPTAVEAVLDARGIKEHTPGERLWRLAQEEVQVRRFSEGGRLLGTELRLPLSGKADVIRELVKQAALIAVEANVRLFDPQLAQEITALDSELVSEQYQRMTRYAGEFAGVPEAVQASFNSPDPGALKPGTKILLAIAGFVLLLILLANKLF
jgi:hypothetical protein